MKKHIFTLSLVLAGTVGAFAGGDEKDLMARMGFSKQEIAKFKASHPPMTAADAESTATVKDDPAQEAAANAKDAAEIAQYAEDAVKKSIEDAATDAKITSDPAMLVELAKTEYAAAVALDHAHRVNVRYTRNADVIAKCSAEVMED